MKINLTHKDELASALLWVYKSPESEMSIVKGVPLHLVPTLKKLIRELYPNRTLSVRYRGPRPRLQSKEYCIAYRGQSDCLKADATSAAIYIRGCRWDHATQEWTF